LVAGLPVLIEQVRQVASGSHRQPSRNPFNGNGSFAPQPHGQLQLKGMILAPSSELLLADTFAA
jgi:hypothetical protein